MKLLSNPVARVVIVLVLLLVLISNPATFAALLLRVQAGLVAVAGTLTLAGVLYGLFHLFHHEHHEHGGRQIVGSIIGGALLATLPQWLPIADTVAAFLVGILIAILKGFHG
jgi:hypothetical protein